MESRKARTYPVDTDEGTFQVWYQVCPAEPDVGIPYPYIEMEVEECPEGVELTDEIEDEIRSKLYWELDL